MTDSNSSSNIFLYKQYLLMSIINNYFETEAGIQGSLKSILQRKLKISINLPISLSHFFVSSLYIATTYALAVFLEILDKTRRLIIIIIVLTCIYI